LPWLYTIDNVEGIWGDIWGDCSRLFLKILGKRTSQLKFNTLHIITEWAPSHFRKHSAFRNVPHFFPLIPGTYPTSSMGIFIYFILYIILYYIILLLFKIHGFMYGSWVLPTTIHRRTCTSRNLNFSSYCCSRGVGALDNSVLFFGWNNTKAQ